MSSLDLEILESDGLGGYALLTPDLIRLRRYHGILVHALSPPTSRIMLVNGFEAWVESNNQTVFLTTQSYANCQNPPPQVALKCLNTDPNQDAFWPVWIFTLKDGTEVRFELTKLRGSSITVLYFKANRSIRLALRLLISGRSHHSLHFKNDTLNSDANIGGDVVIWQTYPSTPEVVSLSNATYQHRPDWYYNFHYELDKRMGYDCSEDLFSPGIFNWQVNGRHDSPAVLILGAGESAKKALCSKGYDAVKIANEFRRSESQRRSLSSSKLERCAEHYLVRRDYKDPETKSGLSIIAGYPWFSDWGRDTFISLRGLCLSTKRFNEAAKIFETWISLLNQGMFPNRFPVQDLNIQDPEYNSVDASLWFIISADLFLKRTAWSIRIGRDLKRKIEQAIADILSAYIKGTRYQIICDSDGLLKCGTKGIQLTWMDAKIGDLVVTPRIGKPVEIQALWLNALKIGARRIKNCSNDYQKILETGLINFESRFWNPDLGCLYDVVDQDHQALKVDPTLRPNQLFALGALPLLLVSEERAKRALKLIEQQLLTPYGLRTLAPSDPNFHSKCIGTLKQRDLAYHQGTAWGWLMGPFIESWLRLEGNTKSARKTARQRFYEPWLETLQQAGLDHISEIYDGEAPHLARGAPFQAWSIAEALRIKEKL